MKPFLLLFLVAFLISACSKSGDKANSLNGHTIVTGRLLDASTLEPIAGGMVTIQYGIRSTDTLTGPDGAYVFDFEHEDKYIYHLTAKADKYLGNGNIGIWHADYPSGKPSPVQRIELNKLNQTNIKLPPEGFVKYHLKQTKSFNGNIEIRILPHNSLSVISYNGQVLDVNYIDRLSGGTYHRVGCSIIRNNDSLQSFIDTLFVPRFDTLLYTIEF